MQQSISIFWFRRDLRIDDNHGFYKALVNKKNIQPIFIFDENILEKLPNNDKRVSFIWNHLSKLNNLFKTFNSAIWLYYGKPEKIISKIISQNKVNGIYTNQDFEPYGIDRDKLIKEICKKNNVNFCEYIDHIIFKPGTVLKKDKLPYTIYTPFKNKWLEYFNKEEIKNYPSENLLNNLNHCKNEFFTLDKINFIHQKIEIEKFDISLLPNYDKNRDFPATNGTTKIGTHLRFGTYSIRKIILKAAKLNNVFLSELIWREFFINILYHFPHVVTKSFKEKYDSIEWGTDQNPNFKKWCEGKTGYPIIDAGMRELNNTGFMHNRVRMICGSFLCKNLLINWRAGEKYFAEKLMDYELASNNGNWQWVAGTGCDAAPYFRIFNPLTQTHKFDPKKEYISKWIPELNELSYPKPIIDYKFSKERALSTYKKGLEKNKI